MSAPVIVSDPLIDEVAVIGGGPAGLMAAEGLARAGVGVTVYEAKPSLGRKFLRAGIGGLNLTHGEDYQRFCARYEGRQPQLQPMLERFPPSAVRAWAADLGIETFEGSSGRVFPVDMKAAPLLRAWVHRLRAQGVRFRLRHRWLGWNDTQALRFATPDGEVEVAPRATILALGGGSWPQLGSDAAWLPWLAAKGVDIAPLQSANCGFDVDWSDHFKAGFAGTQVKPVALSLTDAQGVQHTRQGELVVTDYGLEGSLIYAFSRHLRDSILAEGQAAFTLDLAPGRSAERVMAELAHPRGARSISSHLQSRAGIKGVKAALLREALGKEAYTDTDQLARAIKALPVVAKAARPIAEAISTAGGVRFEALDERLMLNAMPGVFVAGEMLDWEAPTGGYLLTACLAQGVW
ncbi:MAG: TIGR03862 family flavoprotein, partial [Alcaligenaceae bacterium]|nr:TIGR03862 family flavoprotein [Alcaligenaceae bacterium]